MMARVFLQDRIDAPKRNPILIFMGIFRKGFGISSLIPIKVRGTRKERERIILANIFLLLFYGFFISIFITLLIISF
jgi:hypothetical protein